MIRAAKRMIAASVAMRTLCWVALSEIR